MSGDSVSADRLRHVQIRVWPTSGGFARQIFVQASGPDDHGVLRAWEPKPLDFEIMQDSYIATPILTTSLRDRTPDGVDPLQVLMDDLWRLGLRPEGARGTAGQHEALSAHLEDMRALVAKSFDVSLATPKVIR